MQEAKDPKPTGAAASEEGAGKKDPEATSRETLSELEEKERVSDQNSESDTSSAPSPDGAFDEERTGRDDAGPM
jgi:hypothetical protein